MKDFEMKREQAPQKQPLMAMTLMRASKI